ncbi:DNA-binding beta-propeller fold protein YncE [Pedobacter steynii]|uniref:DNA-binding beta-propeller fold protein YncE n=1 Tax=Pedobacter steynii TaxID=430522 RepID=A0A1G9JAP7_9SPHI|nr:hypothetical protein [Pedobacter steynii]NQX38188.1 hypothetical protein [Pedobacter steynii]SDL34286.1 DNA-binding beta-propeller fold protein YncE [Pedobacter steynii]
MNTSQTPPGLSFAINSQDQDNTIYITQDPLVNKLTFTIDTNVSNTVFTPGSLVDPDDVSNTKASLIYLDLSPLQIPVKDFNQIVCEATGWQFQHFANSIIGMAPLAGLNINASSPSVEISISKLILPNPPSGSNVNLWVRYYHVSPINYLNIPGVTYFKVSLLNAPENKKDLHEAIDCVLVSPSFIVNTIDGYPQVKNSITFAFKPGANPVPVIANANTSFTLSFVYAPSAPGCGALTSPQSALDFIKVQQEGSGAAWTVTPDNNVQNPGWILQPPSQKAIIGVDAVVSFDVNDIITRFEPGPTLMHVQYHNVPGYNDGAYSIVLDKIPHVSIASLEVSPNPSVIVDGTASVELSWIASDYTSLMLMPFYEDVTQLNTYTAKLEKSEVITLVATGSGSSANQAISRASADVLPVINAFGVTPSDVYFHDYPHESRFFWDVATNDTVLLADDSSKNTEIVPAKGTKVVSVSSPGMWSLIPQDSANPHTLARNVLIRSFNIEAQANDCGFSPLAAVASPSAAFIAVLNKAANILSLRNPLDFSEYAAPIPTGAGPVDQVFSYGGQYLFVLNSGGSVTIVKTIWNGSTGIYNFSVLQTIAIEGTPVRIAISNDDKYIFVTTSLIGFGKLIVIENKGGDVFGVKQDIEVTQNPSGIGIDPCGLNVYVAMTGDDSVAVISYSAIDQEFKYNRSIVGLPAHPVDIAVGDPHGKTLLVVCGASNVLMALNAGDDDASTGQRIEISGAPVRITVTPDRAYAFIVCNGTNAATLISCYSGAGNCKIMESAIPAGTKPVSVTMAYDGTAAYVSNADHSVTSFNLVNYQLRNTPVNVGKQPTDVAVSADGKFAVSWHNVLFISNKPNYTKGIYIYETDSGAISTRLETKDIIKCVFSPSGNSANMYVIQQDEQEVTILETGEFAVKSTIPIPAGAGGLARFPVELGMSANGLNLYVISKDASGKYSFLAYTCDESKGVFSLKTDLTLFTSSASNHIMMQYTPDGNYVFVGSGADKKIRVLQLGSNGLYNLNSNQINLDILARTMVVSPDNNTLYVILQQNMKSSIVIVNIKDLKSEEYLFPATYATLVNFQQAVISADGKRIFITDANIAGLRVLSTMTLRVIQTLSWEQNIQYPMGIAMQGDDSRLFITGFFSGNMAMINQIN